MVQSGSRMIVAGPECLEKLQSGRDSYEVARIGLLGLT